MCTVKIKKLRNVWLKKKNKRLSLNLLSVKWRKSCVFPPNFPTQIFPLSSLDANKNLVCERKLIFPYPHRHQMTRSIVCDVIWAIFIMFCHIPSNKSRAREGRHLLARRQCFAFSLQKNSETCDLLRTQDEKNGGFPFIESLFFFLRCCLQFVLYGVAQENNSQRNFASQAKESLIKILQSALREILLQI